MPLTVDVGYSSLTGPRPRNEDFCGVVTPTGSDLDAKGILAAVADGVGGHEGGREAAEATVRGLLGDYYATPETWAVPQALDTVLTAANRWLIAQGAVRKELSGMATTLSAVVLRGRRYVTAHVGDSRIYLLRDGALLRLTSDHVWEHPDMRTVLKRAVGLDGHLQVDFGEGELAANDVFLLASDGVWNSLGDVRLTELLLRHADAQEAASAIADTAESGGAADNCTAVVLRVAQLPSSDSVRDWLTQGRDLPLPPRLKPGQLIDGLQVESLLHESLATLLYRVRDAESGQQLVLKTLRLESNDSEAAAALMHEEWLARRVVSHYFPQVVQREARRHLYYLMSWHEGASLQAQLDTDHHFSAAEAVQLGLRLLKGVAALHRLGIVHRDIKPANLHAGQDGRLRILDLGVAASDGAEFSEINNPGTPSYMAPERYAGAAASVSSDLYACGVTVYHLLTRKYPYGEVEPFQNPKFGDPLPPSRYRPDLPGWLEEVLLKAVAREPKNRFETAEEFLLALERGERAGLRVPRRTPLAERNAVGFWRAVAAMLLLVNLILAWLLLGRP